MMNFLSEVERFLADHQMPDTTFGWESVSDYSFVRDLRGGRSPRLSTVERVMAWMDEYDAAHPNKKRREWRRLRRAEEIGARKARAAEKAKVRTVADKRTAARLRRQAASAT
jgi:hypothetical protein